MYVAKHVTKHVTKHQERYGHIRNFEENTCIRKTPKSYQIVGFLAFLKKSGGGEGSRKEHSDGIARMRGGT